MDLRVVAIAAVALVGIWCLVVLPAMWLSGTMSQEEETGGHDCRNHAPTVTTTADEE